MARSTERTLRALTERYFTDFPDEAARLLEGMSLKEVVRTLESQTVPASGRVLQQLTPDMAAEVLRDLSDDAFRGLMHIIDPVRAAGLLARLEPGVVAVRVSLLDEADAKELRSLMSYPQETAGSVMDPRIAAFRADATVKEALASLRALRGRPIADVFVIDSEGLLSGALPLQELAVADPGV